MRPHKERGGAGNGGASLAPEGLTGGFEGGGPAPYLYSRGTSLVGNPRMTPPSAPRALGTATRFLVAALMLGAVALVVRLRAAQGEAAVQDLMALADDWRAIGALYALPNGAVIQDEP